MDTTGKPVPLIALDAQDRAFLSNAISLFIEQHGWRWDKETTTIAQSLLQTMLRKDYGDGTL